METNFEMFDVAKQTKTHFYMEARTKSGGIYKATTLTNTRHALNRYLKRPPFLRKIDIISNPESAGNGEYPEIKTNDLTILYNTINMDKSTLTGLANRVRINV